MIISYAKGIINYLSRKERITEDDWKVICPMIDLALSKSGLWHSIEDCLEKTDNLYDAVVSSINKMTHYSETIYEFNADRIICELGLRVILLFNILLGSLLCAM